MTKVEEAFSAVRKKNARYIVTSPMRNAFEYAKQQVASIDLLLFPDDAQELFIDADASQFGCGAMMLYQYDADRLHKLPLRFMAHVFRTLLVYAIKWSTIEKECSTERTATSGQRVSRSEPTGHPQKFWSVLQNSFSISYYYSFSISGQ